MSTSVVIPGVTNVAPSLLKVEESFRGNRTVSNSGPLKGPHCNIDNMRLILQNWFSPQDIPEEIMSQKSKGRYRSVVYAYLKDKSSSKCSKRFRPLIEEYRSYITDEEKN